MTFRNRFAGKQKIGVSHRYNSSRGAAVLPRRVMVRVVLAVAAKEVKMRAAVGRCLENVGICPLKSFGSGDLLDQIDDTSAQFATLNPHKRLGERKAIRGGEKVRDISR